MADPIMDHAQTIRDTSNTSTFDMVQSFIDPTQAKCMQYPIVNQSGKWFKMVQSTNPALVKCQAAIKVSILGASQKTENALKNPEISVFWSTQ